MSLVRRFRSTYRVFDVTGRLHALAAIVLVCFGAGCTTAPSWPSVQECNQQQNEFPNLCFSLADWQIARDFKALAGAAAVETGQFGDTSTLKRLAQTPTHPAYRSAVQTDGLLVDPNFAPARSGYRLGPLDEVTITVWGTKEIWSEITDQSQQPSRVTTVQEDGTIVLPLLANVPVAGLTLSEALARITERYKSVLASSFQVDGQITKYRSQPVQLDGAISKPGTVYISNEIRTLGQAISFGGGGPAETAEPSKAVLVRGGKRYQIDYVRAQSGANDQYGIALEPDDRIYFPSRESGQFYVMGEVALPGAFPIPPKGVSVAQGLAMARGPLMVSSDMTSIFLLRVNEEQPKIYLLTLGDIMANRDVPIVPGDRIFVSTTTLELWRRTLTQIFPFFSTTFVLHSGFGVNAP